MDAPEFKSLFLPASQQMYHLAFRLTGNRQEAEDLVQESFLRLWTRRDRIGQIERPEAYASTILRHLFCDRLRVGTLRESQTVPEQLPLAASDDIVKALEQADISAHVKAIIAQLPASQRIIITLKDVEGLEYNDIAKRVGMTEGNVRVILSRARKTVRAHFKDK